MRSCALRIFDAATISIAFVIFFVFSTLLILPRISLPTAMSPYSFCVGRRPRWGPPARLKCARFLEISNGGGQRSFAILVQLLGFFDLGQQSGLLGLQVSVHARFERQHRLDRHVVQEALVDGK